MKGTVIYICYTVWLLLRTISKCLNFILPLFLTLNKKSIFGQCLNVALLAFIKCEVTCILLFFMFCTDIKCSCKFISSLMGIFMSCRPKFSRRATDLQLWHLSKIACWRHQLWKYDAESLFWNNVSNIRLRVLKRFSNPQANIEHYDIW